MTAPALPAPPTIEQKLRERMQVQLMDLVPQEVLDEAIARAVKDFLHGAPAVKESTYHGDRVVKSAVDSQLKTIVEKEINEQLGKAVLDAVKAKVRTWLDAEATQAQVNTMSDQVIANAAPAFINGLVRGMMAPVAEALVQNIPVILQNMIWSGQLKLGA